ncbi:MAG: hypothetical protein HKM95_18100 [Inquilinus sp.]|nr:hypothetical protein [Inquilinus sp.]
MMAGALAYEVMELLCSRLCHDLISPVGAINNGVELVEDLGEEMAGEAMGLIAQSGRRAAGRLKCYRVAYGAAGAQATIGLDEAHEIASGYLEGGKVGLSWPSGSEWGEAGPPRGTVKVVLNAIVLAEESLPQGGRITVEFAPLPAPGTISIQAEGKAAALRDGQAAALDGAVGGGELTARTVHAYVTGLFARNHGIDLQHSQVDDGRLKLQLTMAN